MPLEVGRGHLLGGGGIVAGRGHEGTVGSWKNSVSPSGCYLHGWVLFVKMLNTCDVCSLLNMY